MVIAVELGILQQERSIDTIVGRGSFKSCQPVGLALALYVSRSKELPSDSLVNKYKIVTRVYPKIFCTIANRILILTSLLNNPGISGTIHIEVAAQEIIVVSIKHLRVKSHLLVGPCRQRHVKTRLVDNSLSSPAMSGSHILS